MKIKIIKAKKENYKEVGFLFDLYRQFYKYKTEIKKSTKYIKERISKKESTIFLCYCDKEPVGFVQLYETFDSLNINKKLVLYDLYVKKEFRQIGIGKSLMDIAKKFPMVIILSFLFGFKPLPKNSNSYSKKMSLENLEVVNKK